MKKVTKLDPKVGAKISVSVGGKKFDMNIDEALQLMHVLTMLFGKNEPTVSTCGCASALVYTSEPSISATMPPIHRCKKKEGK